MHDTTEQWTPPLLIVTDLDGTLLDHHNYGFEAARPALLRAAHAHIPVIPNTSKTGAELLILRSALGSRDPFVIENGSAICLPQPPHQASLSLDEYHQEQLGVEIGPIRQLLQQLKAQYRFESFADWSAATLAEHTGLSLEAAQAAAQRCYSEPLLWQDSDSARQAFLQQLAHHGLHALQGGRFLTVLGANADKGKALARLRSLYQQGVDSPTVIALGDSGNDRAMLEQADIAVVIANPSQPRLELQAPEVIYSQNTGPEGWNETIQQLLDRFHIP